MGGKDIEGNILSKCFPTTRPRRKKNDERKVEKKKEIGVSFFFFCICSLASISKSNIVDEAKVDKCIKLLNFPPPLFPIPR